MRDASTSHLVLLCMQVDSGTRDPVVKLGITYNVLYGDAVPWLIRSEMQSMTNEKQWNIP
jgi:hypothetical protein